jgi:hypothetical protein
LLIYLDQNTWSNLAKLELGTLHAPDAAAYEALLTTLRSLVRSGKVLCPVAFPHLAETSSWRNVPAREALVELFVTLSQGVCLRFWNDCITDERMGRLPEPVSRPIGLVPREAHDLPYVREVLDSPDHETALRIAFESTVDNPALTEITIDFDQHTAAALEAAHDPRAQRRPEEAEGPLLAFAC